MRRRSRFTTALTAIGVLAVAAPALAASVSQDRTEDVWRQTFDPQGNPVYARDVSYPTADITRVEAADPVDTGRGSSVVKLKAALKADPRQEEFGFLVFGLDAAGTGDVNGDPTHIVAIGFGELEASSGIGRATDAAFSARKVGCPTFAHTWTSPTVVEVTFDTNCIGAPRSLGVGAQTLVIGDQMFFADFAPEVTGTFSEQETPPQKPAFVLQLPGHGTRITPSGRDTSATCAGSPDAGFPDAQGNVHEASIDCAAAKGLTKGKADGTYGTGDELRRDQIASFLVNTMRAAGLSLPTDAPDAFSDDEGNVHEANIDILADLGIVDTSAGDGTPITTYRPGGLVSRADMAEMVFRTAALTAGYPIDYAAPDYFTDDDQLAEAREIAIGGIAELGIVTGKGDATYAPAQILRRDQMATFLTRLLDALS